jgi:hypothetical protein
MGSVSSTNRGVAAVLQILSGESSASVSSALSSQAVQSALESASPRDIVQLSQVALQLQEAAGLFGTPSGSTSAAPSAAAREVSELL